MTDTPAIKRVRGGPPWSIGIIVAGIAAPMEGMKEGLRGLGHVDGGNIRFHQREGLGDLTKLPGFAAEMVALDVDVIAVIGAVTARAVRAVTRSIPVVFAVVVEAAGDDLAADPARPDGNLTGVTTFDPDQAATQIGFLRSVIPDLERVAILSDGGVSTCLSNANCLAARALGLTPQLLRVTAPEPDFRGAFAAMEAGRAQALVVLEEPVTQAWRKQIGEMAAARRLPTVFPRGQVDAGGLFAYGTDLGDATRYMARYVERLLKGAVPADLPIEAALSHSLVVNLNTARTLGVTVPAELLARADRVID
jgi:putative ABC transport system substrate-binding protein